MTLKRKLTYAGGALGALLLLGGTFVAYQIFHDPSPAPPQCHLAALPRGPFSAPQMLTSARSPGRYQFEPSAVVTSSGAVLLSYSPGNGMFGKNAVGIARLAPDGTAEATLALHSDREQYFDTWMARDRQGTLYAVWLGFFRGLPEKEMQIGLSVSHDEGAHWSEPISVQDPKDCPPGERGCMDKPMVAVGPAPEDPSKDALLVLYFSEVTGGLRMVRSLDGGKSFAPSVAVADGAYASVFVDPRGAIHVAETEWDEPKANRFGDPAIRVAYTHSEDGVHFAKAQVVSSGLPVPFFFSNPQVLADSKRNLLYVAFPSGLGDAKWDLYLATSRDGGAHWSRTRLNDDAPCATHMIPNAALDEATGEVHVMWLDNRSGAGAVAYSVCQPGGERCSPNTAVSAAPFASFGLKRHSPEWLSEYNTLVVDPARRKLHAVWTQTIDEGSGPTARIFHAEAALSASPPAAAR